jgi:hypothetical protein
MTRIQVSYILMKQRFLLQGSCTMISPKDEIYFHDNAEKAKILADELFPDEKWEKIEDGIYLSPRRAIGKNSNYPNELRDAQILRDLGNVVYLTPEPRSDRNKKYDAIVNGIRFEFKNMHGSSLMTLKDHFIGSRQQAPNVFMNLETSPLSRKQIIKTLYAARNSEDYKLKNKFEGGIIILKVNNQNNLIYLNVDDLEINRQEKTGRMASCYAGEGEWCHSNPAVYSIKELML